MRYVDQPGLDLRAVPLGEVWVGLIDDPHPHVGIAIRLGEGDRIMLSRLSGLDALDLAGQLTRLSHVIAAPNN